MMNNHSTVFVVAGEGNFRESAQAVVRKKSLRAETFSSPAEFLPEFDPSRKGCVILDTKTGDGTAAACLRALKEYQPIIPVIVTAGDADLSSAVDVMQAGAVNFLEKPSDEELSRAVDRALKIEEERHAQRKALAEMRQRLETLTPEELDVFRRLLSGHANKRIATDLDLGLRTVELRRANLVRKMQAASVPDLVRMAILLKIPEI